MTLVNGTDTTTGGDASPTENAQTTAKPAAAKSTKQRVVRTVRRKASATITRAPASSKIGFPYRDLDTGVSVALAMIGAGGGALKTDQLAGVMGLSAGSGNFVLKVTTARMFGLVNYANGMYELTDAGFAIVDRDEKRQRNARAQAFLNVPLYRRTYEEFKGRQLPPRPTGLEQAFIRFGVTPKSAAYARLAFDKSAAQAGYFAAGNDRLIEPIIPGGTAPPSGRPPTYDSGGSNGDTPQSGVAEPERPAPSGLHPFIQGLLDALPEPETNWAPEGRAKWLMTANNIFDLLYKGAGEIQVVLKPSEEKK